MALLKKTRDYKLKILNTVFLCTFSTHSLIDKIKHKFLKYFGKTFFRALVDDGFVEKNYITTTRDSFKDFIFACKIRNQMHTNFEKRKVPLIFSGNFAQKWQFY